MSARDVFKQCHRDWRGFWPNGFAEDLERRLAAAGFKVVAREPTIEQGQAMRSVYGDPGWSVGDMYEAMWDAADPRGPGKDGK